MSSWKSNRSRVGPWNRHFSQASVVIFMQVVHTLRIINLGGYSVKDGTLGSCFLLESKKYPHVLCWFFGC